MRDLYHLMFAAVLIASAAVAGEKALPPRSAEKPVPARVGEDPIGAAEAKHLLRLKFKTGQVLVYEGRLATRSREVLYAKDGRRIVWRGPGYHSRLAVRRMDVVLQVLENGVAHIATGVDHELLEFTQRGEEKAVAKHRGSFEVPRVTHFWISSRGEIVDFPNSRWASIDFRMGTLVQSIVSSVLPEQAVRAGDSWPVQMWPAGVWRREAPTAGASTFTKVTGASNGLAAHIATQLGERKLPKQDVEYRGLKSACTVDLRRGLVTYVKWEALRRSKMPGKPDRPGTRWVSTFKGDLVLASEERLDHRGLIDAQRGLEFLLCAERQNLISVGCEDACLETFCQQNPKSIWTPIVKRWIGWLPSPLASLGSGKAAGAR